MLHCWLVLFLCCCACRGIAITLSDLQYPVPLCPVSTPAPTNSFGQFRFAVDLLGHALTLTAELDPSQVSCRLCAINAAHCNSSLTGLHVTQGTGYNIRVIALNGAGNTTTTRSYALEPGVTTVSLGVRAVFPFGIAQTLCGSRYRVVVLLLLSSEQPVERDFLAIVADAASPFVRCDPRAPPQGLSCRLATRFPYIELSFQNCVLNDTRSHQNDDPPDDDLLASIHSTLYWHQNRDLWPLRVPTLCDESWAVVWDRTAPQNYMCSQTAALYIKPMPWYEAALEAGTAYFNGHGRLDPVLLQTLDTLELYCEARQSGRLTLEDSLLVNLTAVLRERHLPPSDEECEGMALTSNVTLPYFAEHFYDWQLQLFQYMFQLDSMLAVKTALLITAFTVVLVSCMLLAVATLAYLYHKHVENNQYGRVN